MESKREEMERRSEIQRLDRERTKHGRSVLDKLLGKCSELGYQLLYIKIKLHYF